MRVKKQQVCCDMRDRGSGDDNGRSRDTDKGSVTRLRQAVAIDPKLQVLIAHGWADLSWPFMASVLIVDQMRVMGNANRLRVQVDTR